VIPPRCRVCHEVIPFLRRHLASHTCSMECTEASRAKSRQRRHERNTTCRECKRPLEDRAFARCEACRAARAAAVDAERNPEEPPPVVRQPGLCAHCVEDRLVAPAERNGRQVLLCAACEDPAGALRIFEIQERGEGHALHINASTAADKFGKAVR
jgi:hypothetical protein